MFYIPIVIITIIINLIITRIVKITVIKRNENVFKIVIILLSLKNKETIH